MVKDKVYTPTYFNRIGNYYEAIAKDAEKFGVNVDTCRQLQGAAIQLRIAGQVLKRALKNG